LIPLAISCALSQHYPDFEVLVVDDGVRPTPVPDNPRLRYVRLPRANPRLFLGAKLNASIPYAHGEIIMHFDDDDWYAPGRMRDQVKLLLSSGKQVVGYHEFVMWHVGNGPGQPYRFRAQQPFSSGATQAYFRSWWEGHKFPEEVKLGCDTEFSNVAREAGQLVSKTGKGMIVVRQHGDNTWTPALASPQWPKTLWKDLPPAFLAAIKHFNKEGNNANQ
jgi:glycosyltransferase involved in cell wall biosynthesis